jgi:hypothetical protein
VLPKALKGNTIISNVNSPYHSGKQNVCLHHWIEVIAASISFIFFAKISNCSTVRLMPANVCKVKEDQ